LRLPGVGNTTLARRLEAEYRAIRLCPDEWITELDIHVFDQVTRTRIE